MTSTFRFLAILHSTLAACALCAQTAQSSLDVSLPGDGAGEVATFKAGARLFSNRNYTLEKPPAALVGLNFLRAPINGMEIRATKPGDILVLTPVEGQPSSLAKSLLARGFTKDTRTGDFQLFSLKDGPSKRDRVSPYRKTLKASETIKLGKYSIVLGFDTAVFKSTGNNPDAATRATTSAGGPLRTAEKRIPNPRAKPNWDAPKLIPNPAGTVEYSAKSRKFTGISSMAVTPAGRMWATWYSGKTPGEDHNNYVVLATSGDGGKTWEEVLAVDPDGGGPLRAFDPQVWLAPDGSLWFFVPIAQHKGHSQPDTWILKTRDPENKNATWSAPQFMAPGVMMNKPVVLSTGEWMFPLARWAKPGGKEQNDDSAQAYVTRDKGATFTYAGAANVPVVDRQYDEHQIVERKDGSLWMLVRTAYGIGESVSTDRGKTWGDLKPSKIKHTSSRFFISTLASGNMLLVKHGPIDRQTGRSHLTAFLSQDDGLTWSSGLLIDERARTSYPDGQQTADGRIHITYDFSRTKDQHILMTDFTEADIRDPRRDEAEKRVLNNRKIISQGGADTLAAATAPNAAAVPVLFPVPRDVRWITPPDFEPIKNPKMKWADDTMTGRPCSKDPSVIRFNGRYLMYFSLPPNEKEPKPFGWTCAIAESHDLVNWKLVRQITPMQECDEKKTMSLM